METQLWFSFACLAMAVCLYVICDGLKPRKPFRLADYIRRRD